MAMLVARSGAPSRGHRLERFVRPVESVPLDEGAQGPTGEPVDPVTDLQGVEADGPDPLLLVVDVGQQRWPIG